MSIVIKVELAPTNGADDASPTWVDISQYVSLTAGITCNRGRGRTSTTPEPGRLQLTLNNDDGRFTWGNPTGAYGLGLGENAQLRQPIRVSALVGEYDSEVIAYDAAYDYDGYTTVALWTGYVDEWVGFWDNGYRPRVRVTASDRLARLALLNLDEGAIRSEILYDSPVAYYPMNEEAGFVSAGDQSGNLNGSLAQYSAGAGVGTVDFGAGSTPDGVGTCAAVTNTSGINGKYLRSDLIGGGISDAALTLESWVRTTGGVATIAAVSQHPNTSTTAWLIIAAGNVARGGYADLLSPSAYVDSPGTINDGAWHHLALVKSGTGVELYLDGASVGTDSGAATGYALGAAFVAGAAGNYHLDTLLMQDGQIAHVAVYDTALTADRILQHYNAGKSAGSFYGEAAADRFTRLCRLSGLPAAAYATDATATTLVGAQNLGGVGMLDAIQQVTDSERGVVIVNGSGVLTYLSSASIANLTTDVTLAATDINGDVGLTVNDLELINDVTVTRVGGATQRRTDAASVAQIGANAVTVDTLLTTDAEAGALADLLLSQGLVITPRTDDLTLDLAAKFRTLPVAAVCGLDTGSRVTVTGMPTGSPTATIDVLVQGVAHSIAASKWDLTLTVAPALTVPGWELDDATLSLLGSTTRLAYP